MKSSTSFWRRVMAMGAIIANKRRTARESAEEGSQIGTWGWAGPKREREVCFCETASVLREQAERWWCWEDGDAYADRGTRLGARSLSGAGIRGGGLCGDAGRRRREGAGGSARQRAGDRDPRWRCSGERWSGGAGAAALLGRGDGDCRSHQRAGRCGAAAVAGGRGG